MKNLTLIIPAKKEKESLPKFLEEIKDFDVSIIDILPKEDLDTQNAIQKKRYGKLINIRGLYGKSKIINIAIPCHTVLQE